MFNLACWAAAITTNKITIITLLVGRLQTISTIARADGQTVEAITPVTRFDVTEVIATITVLSVVIITILVAFGKTISTNNLVAYTPNAFVMTEPARFNSTSRVTTIAIFGVTIITSFLDMVIAISAF